MKKTFMIALVFVIPVLLVSGNNSFAKESSLNPCNNNCITTYLSDQQTNFGQAPQLHNSTVPEFGSIPSITFLILSISMIEVFVASRKQRR